MSPVSPPRRSITFTSTPPDPALGVAFLRGHGDWRRVRQSDHLQLAHASDVHRQREQRVVRWDRGLHGRGRSGGRERLRCGAAGDTDLRDLGDAAGQRRWRSHLRLEGRWDDRVLGKQYDGQSTAPTGLASVAQLAAGAGHSCAVKDRSDAPLLGKQRQWPVRTFRRVLGRSQQVAAGNSFTCALTTDGTVACWGSNSSGQATVPSGLASVVQVTTGNAHSCALRTDGTVACWGNNLSGQSIVPAGLTAGAQVTAGGSSTCAVKTDGTVVCWGSNLQGQATVPAGPRIGRLK